MTLALATGRLNTYASFVKIEHTVFSLPLIFAGVLLGAHGWPSFRTVGLIVLAATGARVAAMGLNRLIDAEIDRRNPRTKQRELARGAMQAREGWWVVFAGSVVYLLSAAAIAPVCLVLSPIPLVLFTAYPYLKRFTSLAHLGLGIAWSLGPLAGWLATAAAGIAAAGIPSVSEGLPLLLERLGEIGWLWLFSLLWVAGFDVIYATMDEEFDRQAGLHSLPADLGKRTALNIAAVLHAAALICLWTLWRTQLQTPASLAWLLATGALLVWQHAIADKNPEFAFFRLNSIVGFLVLGIVVAGL